MARLGELAVGALMGVNPVGEVVDETGAVLAGTLAPSDAPRYPHATMEEIRIWGEARTAAEARDGPAEDGRAGGDGARAGGEVSPEGAGLGAPAGVVPLTNTVIGCVVTNAAMAKPAICRAADLAHTGIARAVVTKRNGFAVISVKPSRPGIVTVSIKGKQGCNTQRIGIVGVFEPPVTG